VLTRQGRVASPEEKKKAKEEVVERGHTNGKKWRNRRGIERSQIPRNGGEKGR
jgi:hypothetical protein